VKNEKHYSEKLDAILREESENKARELAKLREAEREQREWQRKVDKKNASIRAATEQMLRAAEDRQVREMIASRNKFASVDDRNSIPPYEQDSFGPDTLSFRIFFSDDVNTKTGEGSGPTFDGERIVKVKILDQVVEGRMTCMIEVLCVIGIKKDFPQDFHEKLMPFVEEGDLSNEAYALVEQLDTDPAKERLYQAFLEAGIEKVLIAKQTPPSIELVLRFVDCPPDEYYGKKLGVTVLGLSMRGSLSKSYMDGPEKPSCSITVKRNAPPSFFEQLNAVTINPLFSDPYIRKGNYDLETIE